MISASSQSSVSSMPTGSVMIAQDPLATPACPAMLIINGQGVPPVCTRDGNLACRVAALIRTVPGQSPCRICATAMRAGQLDSDAQIVQFRAWLDRFAGVLVVADDGLGRRLACDYQEVAGNERGSGVASASRP